MNRRISKGNRNRIRILPVLESLESRQLLATGLTSSKFGISIFPSEVLNPFEDLAKPKKKPPKSAISVTGIAGPSSSSGIVTLSGKTDARAKVRLDLGANGSVEQTVKTRANGRFQITFDVGFGTTPIRLSAAATGKKPAKAIVAVIRLDLIPPVIQLQTVPAAAPSQHEGTFAGIVSDVGEGVSSLQVHEDGGAAQPVVFGAKGNFSYTTTLPLDGSADGRNTVSFTAVDKAGNATTSAVFTFTVDTRPPTITIQSANQNSASRSDPTVIGHVADASSGVVSLLTKVDAGSWTPVTFSETGAFQFTPGLPVDGSADGAHTVSFMATDAVGLSSQPVPLTFRLDHTALPDPSQIAPALTNTTNTSLLDATSFLYTGPDAIQTGVSPGIITFDRAAVVRGQVFDQAGDPLAGVTISALSHPEYGLTYTRADGMLDLVVNGGGLLTIQYTKAGYLPVERQIDVPDQDSTWLPDIVMSALDSHVTTIDLGSTQPFQVARGTVETDGDGTRQATLLFPQGVQATMTLPDGANQALTTLHVRATEYTVGADGPEAMPASLPPTSGYTYAVELSDDAAIQAGATGVDFSQALPLYVENFLNFPVGTAVPTGYYDRYLGQWIASPNGLVIKILAEPGGLADLDIDGSGKAASSTVLAGVGVTDAERVQIAAVYKTGESLWRVPISHFTPWDCNWPYGPPQDAQGPTFDPNSVSDATVDSPNLECGSIIGVENQTLGESIHVTGTPFSLVYNSHRTAGGSVAGRTLTIPLSEDSVPADLKRIDLTISTAGRMFEQSFAPAPNLSTTFIWDGLDAYGRSLQGTQPVTIKIGYVYDAQYYAPATQDQAFAVFSGVPIQADRARQEITLYEIINSSVELYSLGSGFGGWSLDAQDQYDPVGKILFSGVGTDESAANSLSAIIGTVAGNGVFTDGQDTGDGGPAIDAGLDAESVVVGPDGSLYISSDALIRRVTPDGIITTVAGDGSYEYSGDGGPALQAGMEPGALAFGPDGSLYVVDEEGANHVWIRRIAPNGIISTVAGNGIATPDGALGDGGRATEAGLFGVNSIAVAPDGTLYIADALDHRVRRVGTDGIITTIAGDGQAGVVGLGGPAIDAQLGDPTSIALGPDGSLFIADGRTVTNRTVNDRILRVTPDGIISKVAGLGQSGSYSGDGGPATQAEIPQPRAIAVDADGSLYIALSFTNYRVLRVGTDGIITTIAGNGTFSSSGDNGPATAAGINPISLAVGPDGKLYVVDDAASGRVRVLAPDLPGSSLSDFIIPSQDGSQVYEFDPTGRQLETTDALTGALLYAFGYNTSGELISITDGNGNITSIKRDASGEPTAIVGPYGQTTKLTVNAQGYLASVADPAGETTTLGYGVGGLLTSMTDPLGNASAMSFDSDGRLVRDENAADGVTTLARTELGGGSYEVSMTNAEGGTRQYLVERLSDGSLRRTFIDGQGFSTITLQSPDGTTVTTAPDGTRTTVVLGPDPRFGMLATLVASQTVTTPAGLTSTITDARTATFGSVAGGVSLTQLTDTITTNGNASTSDYDCASRTISRTGAAGRTSITTLDAKGRVISVQVSGVASTEFTYNTTGQLTAVTQGARTVSYSYDAHGDVARITDPLSRSVTFQYDLADRLIMQTQPDGNIIAFSYDAAGNMVGLAPPTTPETTFGYDANNRLNVSTAPSTGTADDTTRYTYDLAGQVVKESLPGGAVIIFAYCECGRLTSITTPQGTYAYTYSDTTGVLSSIDSPDNVQVSYGYDGALLTSTTLSGAVAGQVAWTYDANFQVGSESVDGGNTVNFAYDKDGLLTQAGALALTNDPATGFLMGTTLGSVTDSLSYDSFGETSVYQADIGQSVAYEVDFTCDALGRVSRLVETIGGATTTTDYGYDVDDRLITVTENGVLTQSYKYDANGNRLRLTTTSGTVDGTYNAQDELLSYGTDIYTYTAAGQLHQVTDSTTGQTTRYTYDVFGDLTQIELPDGHSIQYLIDGQGRRVGEKVDGVLTVGLIYRSQLQPDAETDGMGKIVERFVYSDGSNSPDYMVKDGVTYRFVADQSGSIRLVINVATGEITERIDYDAFGNVLLDTNPGFQPFGFAGGLYDQHTGLTHFGVRDYDPSAGRFLSHDLMILNGGASSGYAYSNDNPTNYTDVTGLSENDHERIRPINPLDFEGVSQENIPSELVELEVQEETLMISMAGGASRCPDPQARSTIPPIPGATNLREQLAAEQAMADPTQGRVLQLTMGDPRWPASDGWVKMAQNIEGIEVHYVYNLDTGAVDDFKVK
jgi:RHS repeat-associated protein